MHTSARRRYAPTPAVLAACLMGPAGVLAGPAPAPAPANTTSPTTAPAERPFAWGKRGQWGLHAGVRATQDKYYVGDPITVECAIKNTGRGPYRFVVPGVKQSASHVTDFFVLLKGRSRSPAAFSSTSPPDSPEDRVVTVGVGQVAVLRRVRLDQLKAYAYERNLRMEKGYMVKIDGRKRVALASKGTFAKTLDPGTYHIAWLFHDRQRRWADKLQLSSGAAAIELEFRPLAQLTEAQKQARLKKLMAKLYKSAYGASEVKDELAKMGRYAVPALLAAAASKKVHVRQWAGSLLPGTNDPRAVGAILMLLKEPALQTVMAYHSAKHRDPRVRGALLDLIAKTGSAEVKMWGLRGLSDNRGKLPESMRAALVHHKDARVRHAACVALSNHPDPGSRALFLGMLRKESDHRLRALGAELLGKLGCRDDEVLGAMVDALGDPEPYVHQIAAHTLRKLTGQHIDYPVAADAKDADKKAAIDKWRAWWAARQKKKLPPTTKPSPTR